MKPRVYIESTIFSYLAARPSRDQIVEAHQIITRQWWETRRQYFDAVVSEAILLEISAGDVDAARRRLEIARSLPSLRVDERVRQLARRLVESGTVPESHTEDATHIAFAAVYGIDYLVTWNCKHIANAAVRPAIEKICWENAYMPCIICTPEELMNHERAMDRPDSR